MGAILRTLPPNGPKTEKRARAKATKKLFFEAPRVVSFDVFRILSRLVGMLLSVYCRAGFKKHLQRKDPRGHR
jgi:hypothetical protein